MILPTHSTSGITAKLTIDQGTLGSAEPDVEVALLTGGFDRPYAFGLSKALASKGVKLDLIGSRELDSPEILENPRLTFLNLHGDQRHIVSRSKKISQYIATYAKLLRYAATAKPKIFHILWNNKFRLFDRTALMLYYKLLGKKIVFTAHNVNSGIRDGNDSVVNRFSLRIQYQLVDHIFVHTDKMKSELIEDFGVKDESVTVIPFGVNNSVPDTELTVAEAKRIVGVESSQKTVLFFGGIRPYKGLEYLVAAFQQVAQSDESYRLIIAGEPKKEAAQYWKEIEESIKKDQSGQHVIQEIEYISDAETEIYFKAADVLVLPYTTVFQSGVLFLAYNFGLPVIATDVGSLRDDVVEGETGYCCHARDAADLARAIETYFNSDLYSTLDSKRSHIKDFAHSRNSWGIVSNQTCNIYAQLLSQTSPQQDRSKTLTIPKRKTL